MLQRLFDYLRWFLRTLVRQFFDYRCMHSAAALTFTTLLALVPVMTVTYVFLSAFPELSVLGKSVEGFVFENFVPDAGAAVARQLSEFSAEAAELGVLSFAMVLVTALLALFSIEEVFNVIWRVPAPRTGLQRLLVYWGVLTFGPPLLIGALLATSYLYALPLVTDLDTMGVREFVIAMLPTLAITATFTLLYFAVPNTPVPFLHALLGGVLTMLLFEAARWLFAQFVVQSVTAVVYGTFAAVPFFLIWLYLVWSMVLAGAVFVRTLSLPAEHVAPSGQPRVLQCARVLAMLNEAHMEGAPVNPDTLVENAGLRPGDRQDIFEVLEREKLLRRTDDGLLTLGRSLKTVTLWDLYRHLPEALDPAALEPAPGLETVVGRLREFAESGTRQLDVSLDGLLSRS